MPFSLSPQTTGALIKALAEGNSHSQLGTLFMTLGVEQWDQEGDRINKEKRAQGVLKGLRAADDEPSAKAALALAQSVAVAGAPSDGVWGGAAASWWQPLLDALAADGFEYDDENERLVPAVSGISVAAEQSLLERGLIELGWDNAANHYRQAVDNFSSGNWESANGQCRSFLEDLIPRVVERRSDGKAPGEARAALQHMKDKGLLREGEFDFARGLWGMCNSRGSHAGRSVQRRHVFDF
jgi:hypothetical protein